MFPSKPRLQNSKLVIGEITVLWWSPLLWISLCRYRGEVGVNMFKHLPKLWKILEKPHHYEALASLPWMIHWMHTLFLIMSVIILIPQMRKATYKVVRLLLIKAMEKTFQTCTIGVDCIWLHHRTSSLAGEIA